MTKQFNINSLLALALGLALAACSPGADPTPGAPPRSTDKTIRLIQDEFEAQPLVVVGSEGRNLMVSYWRTLNDGTVLEMTADPSGFPVVMQDQEGTRWNIWGEAVEGPRIGSSLTPTYGYMGYWFSFAGFFPELELFGDTPNGQSSLYENIPSGDWRVPTNQVYFGTSFDAIRSIEFPNFTTFSSKDFDVSQNFYLEDDDLVIGIKVGNEMKLYPHNVLDWHEIANDDVGNEAVAIVYCPLTGTAQAWGREVNGQTTTFGISGLLYNNNVMPYDRSTESVWSQMRQESVQGPLIGQQAELYNVIEMPWSQWQEVAEELEVVEAERREYPYGSYRSNHDFLLYPMANTDARFQNKMRVHGVVVNGKARVYTFDNLKL